MGAEREQMRGNKIILVVGLVNTVKRTYSAIIYSAYNVLRYIKNTIRYVFS